MSERPKVYPQDCPTLRNLAGLRMCPFVGCRHNLVRDRVRKAAFEVFKQEEKELVRIAKNQRLSEERMPLMASITASEANDEVARIMGKSEEKVARLIVKQCEAPLFDCSIDFAEVEFDRMRHEAEEEMLAGEGPEAIDGMPQRTTKYAVPTEAIGKQMDYTGERIRQIGDEAQRKAGVALELMDNESVLQSIGKAPRQEAMCGGVLVELVTPPNEDTIAIRPSDGSMELAAYVQDGTVHWEEPFGLCEPSEVWAVDWAKKAGKSKKGGV